MSSANARVRLCVVAASLRRAGGQSIQAARLVKRLRALDDFDVTAVPIDPVLPSLLAPLGRVRYVRTFFLFPIYVFSLFRAIRRCDVVHVFSASYFSYLVTPLPAIIIARLLGRPVTLNYHSGEAEDHLARWPLSRATMRWADAIVVPSEYLRDVFRRFGFDVHVIANFVEAENLRFRLRAAKAPRFLANRHLEDLYNVGNVLHAFALIQSRRPDASLVVAGDGSRRSALEALASQLGLRQTKFVGAVDSVRMAALYDDAEFLINGSNIDNMPVSIIEAFVAGLPVVSTAAGGIPSIIDDGETGLLVPLNDPKALADAALTLLSTPEHAARISARSRELASERYVWAAVREQWRSLYLGLAKRSSTGKQLTPSTSRPAGTVSSVGHVGKVL